MELARQGDLAALEALAAQDPDALTGAVLCAAVAGGRPAVVRWLLADGRVPVDARAPGQPHGRLPLFLVRWWPDIYRGMTALLVAAQNGWSAHHLVLFSLSLLSFFFLFSSSIINHHHHHHHHFFSSRKQSGLAEMVDLLVLEGQADLHAKDDSGMTGTSTVSFKPFARVLTFLLQRSCWLVATAICMWLVMNREAEGLGHGKELNFADVLKVRYFLSLLSFA